MTEQELQTLCEAWQKELRLQDWIVRVEMKGHADLSDGKGGTIQWNRNEMTAVVAILDPAQVPKSEPFPPDPEVTLVHELLHITLATFWKEEGTPENVDLEQAITRISHALVRLKREAQRRSVTYRDVFNIPSRTQTKVSRDDDGPLSAEAVLSATNATVARGPISCNVAGCGCGTSEVPLSERPEHQK